MGSNKGSALTAFNLSWLLGFGNVFRGFYGGDFGDRFRCRQ
jgi:hypothetical protein